MSFALIVSPAKKMNVVEGPPDATALPRLIDQTELLLEQLRTLSLKQAKALWKCSDRLARQNYERLATADPRSATTAAAIAYEGIQYQHLAAHVLDEDALAYLEQHLRILSGFYGVLSPLDAVVPYRLEMQARLAMPACGVRLATRDLYAFWADTLAKVLAESFDTVVNVASVEYAKAVTPYLPGLGVRTLTCLFGSVRASDGKLVQRSTEAKAARGSFVRWCAEQHVEDTAELIAFADRGYAFDQARSSDDTLVFVQQ